MSYVDGFVIPLPKKNVATYRRMAKKAAKVWLEYGALEYRECVGDDLDAWPGITSFSKLAKCKADETVVFAWIVYESKAHRNRVLKQVLSDPRLQQEKTMPFDAKRMAYGGFKTIVDM